MTISFIPPGVGPRRKESWQLPICYELPKTASLGLPCRLQTHSHLSKGSPQAQAKPWYLLKFSHRKQTLVSNDFLLSTMLRERSLRCHQISWRKILKELTIFINSHNVNRTMLESFTVSWGHWQLGGREVKILPHRWCFCGPWRVSRISSGKEKRFKEESWAY